MSSEQSAVNSQQTAPTESVALPTPQPPATAYLHEGLVRVCMCCHPGDSIYQRYPHWRGLGLRISHGLCAAHKAEMLAQCAEMKEAA